MPSVCFREVLSLSATMFLDHKWANLKIKWTIFINRSLFFKNITLRANVRTYMQILSARSSLTTAHAQAKANKCKKVETRQTTWHISAVGGSEFTEFTEITKELLRPPTCFASRAVRKSFTLMAQQTIGVGVSWVSYFFLSRHLHPVSPPQSIF